MSFPSVPLVSHEEVNKALIKQVKLWRPRDLAQKNITPL
jgi:hypothetical protein